MRDGHVIESKMAGSGSTFGGKHAGRQGTSHFPKAVLEPCGSTVGPLGHPSGLSPGTPSSMQNLRLALPDHQLNSEDQPAPFRPNLWTRQGAACRNSWTPSQKALARRYTTSSPQTVLRIDSDWNIRCYKTLRNPAGAGTRIYISQGGNRKWKRHRPRLLTSLCSGL